jgi:type IV pilus assembly protein PilA
VIKLLSKKRGFTLIELLVVIAILSVLLVIVLVAINPARQTREARNTQRRADVLTILNAVNQFFVANGSFPDGVSTVSAAKIDDSLGNFCVDVVPDYVAALPFDPSKRSGTDFHFTDCDDYDTGYEIQETTSNRITVSSPESTRDGMTTEIKATR